MEGTRLNLQVIGTGAAGNKSTVNAVRKGVLEKEDIFLINSTQRDIDIEFRDPEYSYIFDTIGGAGKNVSFGKSLTKRALEKGDLGDRLNNWVKEDTDVLVVVGSTTGGTGAGSIGELCNFISEEIQIPVIAILIVGFMKDPRELRNTIEVLQSIPSVIGVQTISNQKCLEGKDIVKAHQVANDELATRLSIMMAQGIVDSEDNIDETDLYNTVAFPGYMTIEHIDLPKLKDMNQFNDLLATMINNSLSLDIDTKKVGKLAIFINLKDSKEKIFVDFDFEKIKEYYGQTYDTFTHIQFEEDQESYIKVILSGLAMPIKEVEKLQEKYTKMTSDVNKEDETFFEQVATMKGDEKDNMYDIGRRRRRDRNKVSGETYIKNREKEELQDKQDGLY